MTRAWGKAGVQLTEVELRERRQRRAKQRLRAEAAERAMLGKAHRKWTAGMVVPAQITSALDEKELYGPEVDRACGVEEPAVDMWEAGALYPSFEQLQALAELTDKTPEFFTWTPPIRTGYETSMRFHVPDPAVLATPALLLRFSDSALADARAMGVRA